MTLVTSDLLAGLLTGYRAIFKTAFTEADKVVEWKRLCLQVESTSDKEAYNWLTSVPGMSEWLDVRKVHGLMAEAYEIKNKNYEGTISVDRNTIEDDKYGMIVPRVRQLAARCVNHPAKLLFQLINAGTSTKTYDGVNFFTLTGRKFGDSGNIANIVQGAYGGSGDAILSGIGAVVLAMRNFKDNRGEYLNLAPDTIICSAVREIAIRNALIPAVAGTVRPEAQLIKRIIVSPYLTSGATAGHDYYLACTENELKPLLFQVRKAAEFVALDKPDSEKVFMQRLIHYGVDGRYAVALLEPRCMVMVDSSN